MNCYQRCMAVLPVLFLSLLLMVVMGSAAESEDVADKRIDYPDYSMGSRYDEYPVVVPKRAALLLDRLMVALKNAMEDEDGQEVTADERSGRANPKPRSLPVSQEDNTMGMQRRGHGSIGGQHKGRVYWRCYFNAVTCFKKK
uniref:Allatostatin CC n=1 Tax=Carabus violaceus TaxID=41075 RepID=A0A7U3MC87_CARVO|nr:allatostatin CC [Carabus violaceus]